MIFDKEKFLEELKFWLDDVAADAQGKDKNFWHRNLIAHTLKNRLTEWKKWKNGKRGNSRKGYQGMLKSENDW